ADQKQDQGYEAADRHTRPSQKGTADTAQTAAEPYENEGSNEKSRKHNNVEHDVLSGCELSRNGRLERPNRIRIATLRGDFTAKRSSYKRNAFIGQLSAHHGAELDVAIAWIRSSAANTMKTPKTWNSRSDISTRLSSHPIGRPATPSISTNVTMMKIPS